MENTMTYQVDTSQLKGNITVPPSKSHTMRAILLASLATGRSTVRGYLPSPDTDAMITACVHLGAHIEKMQNTLIIEGNAGALTVPKQVIDVGNSGQVLRFVAALAALMPHYTVITGDASICNIRPMDPLLQALSQAGALAVSTKGDGHAPIVIRGPITASHMVLDGQDSQPVSALLMMAAFLEGETTIEVRDPGEHPWINLTLYWLDRLGISYENNQFETYKVRGPTHYTGFDYTVPGDWSSAAFPIAAALITHSELTLENLDFEDPQGDKAILFALQKMGAKFEIDPSRNQLKVLPHAGLVGSDINVNEMVDALPILATIACFAKSDTHISGAAIARHKECDRIAAITQELKKMGADIEERPDGLVIKPRQLQGADVHSWHDHRIAMSLAIAGLSCGSTKIADTHCVAKSYPDFVTSFQSLGAKLCLI